MPTRRELFPALGAIRIVYEDAHLLVVAKPAGVPCQSADSARLDDLPHRLKEHLRDRGQDDYLGIHQRLDRATSGVIVYARSREANPGIARQMEGRLVRKRYVVAVRGDVSAFEGSEGIMLRDWLGRDGSVSVVLPERTRKAKEAISRVRVLARRGDRALLEVRIETGRTHQIRAQLAHRRLPVAGDRAYGDVCAPRLMLHAESLRLAHPITGATLSLEAPLPGSFERWLAGEDLVPLEPDALRAALVRARESRWGLGRAGEAAAPTTAFRLLNGAGDGVPGLAVDVYGDHLLAHLYGERALAAEAIIVEALSELGFEGLYLKKHPKQKNTLSDAERAVLAPADPVWGAPASAELVVFEHGVAYSTALGDGLSTGLFLDQRDARLRLRGVTKGKSVLNLFCYAGAFGVAAAVGEAAKVVQVDVSRPALERAARSEALNGVETERVRHDVFAWLSAAAKRGERFDIVVVDPPSYSTAGKSRWTSGADWVGLAAACFWVTAKRGTLLVSSNDGRLTRAALRRHVHEGARQAGVGIAQMKDLPEPPDFPGAKLHRLWVRLGEARRKGESHRRRGARRRHRG